MYYKAYKPEDFLPQKDKQGKLIELMTDGNAHFKTGRLKKDEKTEAEMSHRDVCVYVTEGELELIFENKAKCTCSACGCSIDENPSKKESKIFKVKKSEMLIYPKDTPFRLHALKETVFFMIKI